MEQNWSKTAEEDSEKEMLFFEVIGLSIINIMKTLLLLSQQLGQNIVKILGMKVNLTPQSKSSLEMEEWLPLSTGMTLSNSANSDLIPLVDCDITPCMASDDGLEFCMDPAFRMFVMPLGLPGLPVCQDHIDAMNGLTIQEALTMMVDLMTDEEGIDILKEIVENDDEF